MMTRMALAAALFFAVFVAQAMELGPRETVERGTNQILADFKVNRGKYEADKEQLYAMVKRVALPNFDFERMSKLVLGRHWRQASPEEFGRFQQEFQDLLVRTYATALFEYTGQPINYRPAFEDRGDTIVQATIDIGTAQPVNLEYVLHSNASEWKIFDVTIDGISLVTNYRSAYNAIISSKGLQALIDDLAAKNSGQQKN